MTENEFKRKFTSRFPGKVTAIENSISSGVPDTVVSFDGSMAWVEFKKEHNRDIIVRPLQRNFIVSEHRVGGRVYICWAARDVPVMIRGESILETQYELRGGKLHYKAAELYPRFTGWDEVFQELTGKANV